jgi:hypothetical protein
MSEFVRKEDVQYAKKCKRLRDRDILLMTALNDCYDKSPHSCKDSLKEYQDNKKKVDECNSYLSKAPVYGYKHLAETVAKILMGVFKGNASR